MRNGLEEKSHLYDEILIGIAFGILLISAVTLLVPFEREREQHEPTSTFSVKLDPAVVTSEMTLQRKMAAGSKLKNEVLVAWTEANVASEIEVVLRKHYGASLVSVDPITSK